VHVLDQTELRVDEVEEAAAKGPVDRAHWERRASAEVISLMDQLFARVRAQVPNQQLNYNQQFVGLTDGRRSSNFLVFKPAKSHLRVEARVGAADEWVARLEEAGLSATAKQNRVSFHLTAKLFAEHREGVEALIQHAASEGQG
jgi:hypothetical protein